MSDGKAAARLALSLLPPNAGRSALKAFLESYREATRPPVALRSAHPFISKQAITKWVHCARLGTWKGHRAGEFTFTEDTFRQILANFEAQANPIPLTFEHPHYDGTGPVRKAGWVHRFVVRKSGLYALCEFTDEAVRLNRTGSYRFCSVVVQFSATERQTGKPIGAEILEIGLTDSPFIDGLEPIKL